ncbi:hypothetical protein SELMODRAFT_404012 [Selaginella moellendorffii]|uniref:Uncharacterized protein n=1 Tax=Selaginella moellendorffii TaxID=88036 RepID=D8QTA7_SELML|nr:hypothetical protein SELMODRAFT_404012 [Selaginella moellendorffii]
MPLAVALQHHLGTVAKRFYSTRGAIHALRNASSWMLITLPSKKWVSASVSKNIKQAEEHSVKKKGLILAPQPKSRHKNKQRDEDIQLDKVEVVALVSLRAGEKTSAEGSFVTDYFYIKEDSSRTWHL